MNYFIPESNCAWIQPYTPIPCSPISNFSVTDEDEMLSGSTRKQAWDECVFNLNQLKIKKIDNRFSLGSSERGRCWGSAWRKEELRDRRQHNGRDVLGELGEWVLLSETHLIWKSTFSKLLKEQYMYILQLIFFKKRVVIHLHNIDDVCYTQGSHMSMFKFQA